MRTSFLEAPICRKFLKSGGSFRRLLPVEELGEKAVEGSAPTAGQREDPLGDAPDTSAEVRSPITGSRRFDPEAPGHVCRRLIDAISSHPLPMPKYRSYSLL
jgi:hypothetical protein